MTIKASKKGRNEDPNTGLVQVMFKLFGQCDAGSTAIEYAMMATGIALAISAIIPTLGITVADLYTTLAASL